MIMLRAPVPFDWCITRTVEYVRISICVVTCKDWTTDICIVMIRVLGVLDSCFDCYNTTIGCRTMTFVYFSPTLLPVPPIIRYVLLPSVWSD